MGASLFQFTAIFSSLVVSNSTGTYWKSEIVAMSSFMSRSVVIISVVQVQLFKQLLLSSQSFLSFLIDSEVFYYQCVQLMFSHHNQLEFHPFLRQNFEFLRTSHLMSYFHYLHQSVSSDANQQRLKLCNHLHYFTINMALLYFAIVSLSSYYYLHAMLIFQWLQIIFQSFNYQPLKQIRDHWHSLLIFVYLRSIARQFHCSDYYSIVALVL